LQFILLFPFVQATIFVSALLHLLPAHLGVGFVATANMMQGVVVGASAGAVAQAAVGAVVVAPEVLDVGADAPDVVPAQGQLLV